MATELLRLSRPSWDDILSEQTASSCTTGHGCWLTMHAKFYFVPKELYQSARWMPGQTWHYQMPYGLDESKWF